MSKYKAGDEVVVETAFYGHQQGVVVGDTSEQLVAVRFNDPPSGLPKQLETHASRLRLRASDAQLATAIAAKLKSLRDHRSAMLEELKDLRSLLEADGQPEFELRNIDEYKAVIRHTLNHELVYMQSCWEGAAEYRKEVEKG